ncbi:MAG: glycosyltransferase [Candidatus Eisenbacteria bacterium]
MKICFLGDASMNHVARWVDYFVDRGHECFVVSLEKGQKFKCPFHHVHMPGLPPFVRYPLSTVLVSSLIRSFKPDLVNALFVPNYGFVAALLGVRPLVVTTMGSDVLVVPRRSPFHAWRTRYTFSRVNLVTSDAWMMTEKIVSFGVEPAKILTVPMGIDAALFNTEGRAGAWPQVPTVVSTRQLEPLYNVAQFVEAMPEILRCAPEAKFVIAGEGSERQRLSDLARQIGVSAAVQFTGWLSPVQLASLLKQSTVYVSTSTSDSTSVSLLEAMACGAFPVVSDIAGNREWVENGVNGLLFRVGNTSSLAQAIAGALSRRDLVEQAAEKNRAIVDDKALWSDNMSVVENAFSMLTH